MAKAKTLTGARAKIMIGDKVVGLINNCNWSMRQGKEPVFILGRFSPAEIVPTTQEAVSLDMTGLRLVDAGPYAVANATLLKNLLEEEDFVVTVIDRQTNKAIFRARGCRLTGWSSGVGARGISDVRMSVIGMVGEDEFGIATGGDDEAASANKIDDGV